MEEFLKNARKQLEELDLQGQAKDIDLGKLKQLTLREQQQREEEAASEGFLGGMLLGIVVGALLALIFAPKSGSETREMVAGTASELKHKAEGLVGQSKNGSTDQAASTLSDEPAIEREIGDTSTRSTPGVI
ncbi:MAG TPA: YtxH domain-containing protein [Thermomicrobiales bacterium]|nr:YtxH domain-containing protein [Thermomicrobiales bacterium]